MVVGSCGTECQDMPTRLEHTQTFLICLHSTGVGVPALAQEVYAIRRVCHDGIYAVVCDSSKGVAIVALSDLIVHVSVVFVELVLMTN